MSTNTDDDFQASQLDPRIPRRTYLITYSQADLSKFPTRESFGREVVSAFDQGSGKVKVIQWACCLEDHQNGGQHYHMCLKLSGAKRWKSVKNSFAEKKGVQLHFSDHHNDYLSAYRYVIKTDQNVLKSSNHPNLEQVASPRTKNCIQALRAKRKSSQTTAPNLEPEGVKPKKLRRLSNLEVSEFIVKNNITGEDNLFSVAHAQKLEGDLDLANFLLSRSKKSLSDLFDATRKMESATANVKRANMSRIDVLNAAFKGECCCSDNREWFECASQVLNNNGIHPYVFAADMRKLLNEGRGKFRNIIIVGPANCGKTFILKPIEKLYATFSNPANDKYAWVGADKAEAIFLNDFRWSSELIPWSNFLLLLEGHTVHLPAPKNHFSSDVCINKDTPIFATSLEPIKFVGRYNSTDDRENEMMTVRWHIIPFKHQIPQREQKELKPCVKCFSELVKLGE